MLAPRRHRVAIIISWRDRAEISESFPSIAKCASDNGGSVSIVNFGGDESVLRRALTGAEGIAQIINVEGTSWFNKSVSNNIGASNTSSDLLFFCDCDIIIPPGALDDLFERVHSSTNVFGTVAGVTETVRNARQAGNVAMFGYELQIRLQNGRFLKITDNEEDAGDGTRQAPGLLVVRRTDFDLIEGYNGEFEGWGWEDQDVIARLTLEAGLCRIQSGKVVHISHDEASRTRNYPPVRDRWESRDRVFRQALENYDRSKFKGTVRRDATRPVRINT